MAKYLHDEDELFVQELCDAIEYDGLTLEEIANHEGVTIRDVDKWRQGENLPPRDKQAALIDWFDERVR